MKHATDKALDQLEDLLVEIRQLRTLKEKKRGIFYLRSVAFLHFHEDPTGLFADLRHNQDFWRFPVNSASERKILLSRIKDTVGDFLADKD